MSSAYIDFRERVRRYRPSHLIPALAAHSAATAVANVREPGRERAWDMPWAIGGIARDSLLYGNEHRHRTVTERTVHELMQGFHQTFDEVDDKDAAGLITAMSYEQMPLQESDFEEMSRVHTLFDDPELGPQLPWGDLFGMSLAQAMRAAFILRAWVTFGGGRFDPAQADTAQAQEIFRRGAPQEQVLGMARALSTTMAEARTKAASVPALPPRLQRYAFNPLVSHPLVDLGDAGIWAPQVQYVARALYPANLYYRGIEAWKKRFTDNLGVRVERYVGRQLALFEGYGELCGEIEYRDGKQTMKSVDWIWVTPQAIVLVECKSARMTLAARAGDASVDGITDRYLTHARRQLDRTADLIRAQQPPFDRFPNDRPIVGMTVTSDAFYLGNSMLSAYGPPSQIDSMALSLRELERWVCLAPQDAVNELLRTLADPERRRWSFETVMEDRLDLPRNPLLQQGWELLEFMEQQRNRSPH